MALRGILSTVSFLTIIPAGGSDIRSVAGHMYAFPLVGVMLGAILGAAGLGLSLAGVEPLVTALLVVGAAAVLTGLHHTDGLGDFADGMMAKGTRAKKIEVMRDAATGTAGVFAIVICTAGMILALSLSGGWQLFLAILVAETAAKFSMVLMAAAGRPAAAGSGAAFLEAMDKKRLAAAAAITIPVAFFGGGVPGLVALAAAAALTVLITYISARSVGGVTGDAFGALNEIARLAALLVMVSA